MTAITETLVTGNTVGMREDLSDLISDITPMETIFTTMAGKGPKPKQVFYEWQLDALAAADNTNAQLEGDDVTFDALDQPDRVGNYCQISSKAIIVSDTTEVVDFAGRKSELARQVAKKAKELKRDIEKICIGTLQGASGNDPRKTATMLSYVRTNTSNGGGAAAEPDAPNPTYSDPRTDGTQRAFTVDLLQAEAQEMWTSGGNVDGAKLLVGPVNKVKASGFEGIATNFKNVPGNVQATIVAAADIFISDFGTIYIVASRYQRERDAWLLDFDLIKMRDLRPYQVKELAKTGDATKKYLVREWSLQVENEAGLAGIFDLTTTP